MLFSSILFVCFFLPFVLLGNCVLKFSRVAQNIFLLIASLVFYAWGEPIYVLIMLFSIVMNYVFALLVEKNADHAVAPKVFLVISIVLNLSVLFAFKYLGFFLTNVNSLLGEHAIMVPQITLPIGISFFTFQALSYVVDVYRKDAKAEKNPLYLGLYIAFFPQLIAGPIIRYNTVADEIRNRKETWNKVAAGCTRFVTGFCKKILLANNFAVIADYVFNATGESAVLTSWVGAIAYMLQIFFDFSAYSDMAIGLGLMFGFKFGENFNYPYIARSVSEFWRRWHISLTTWFHEYVYFPLGGSKVKNQDIFIRNVFIVWLLTGIWHGANWTFMVWGMWNFVFLVFERITDFETKKIPSFVRHFYTLWVTLMGMVFFRANDLTHAGNYIGNMYHFIGGNWDFGVAWMLLREYWIYWIIGILLCTPFAKRVEKRMMEFKSPAPAVLASIAYPIGLFVMFMVSFSYLVRGSYNPFIYFNF